MARKWTVKQQLLEKHEHPVYGVAFNDVAEHLQHLVATVGGKHISVYSLDVIDSDLSLLFGYVSKDDTEEFYVVKWMLLSDNTLVLVAAGKRGSIHVLDAQKHTQKCVLLGHGNRVVRRL
jgi:hypothetical protein